MTTMMTTNTTPTPLADAVRAEIEQAKLCEQRWLDDDTADHDDRNHPAWLAMDEQDERVRSARQALAASSEPREWELVYMDGSGYRETIITTSIEDVTRQARKSVLDGDWDRSGGTFWVRVSLCCALSGEADEITVAVEPQAPKCAAKAEHDWQSPHEVVGGIAENPGVHGHGGGVIIREVCRHCGAYRVTDTWAQDRTTGRQGLRGVRYEDADEDSLEWVLEASRNRFCGRIGCPGGIAHAHDAELDPDPTT